LALFAVVALLPFAHAARADDGDLRVNARAAVVMDTETGKVIISKNRDVPLPQASTTKVMTAIVALEKAKLEDTYKVSANASTIPPVRVNFHTGDEVTLEALLYSALLKSANDAATIIAEGIGGSEEGFARLMTLKAHEIGAVNTNYKNASGLPADGHYSTAYDMALILRYALKDPRFQEIATTRLATLNIGEKQKTVLRNHNRLLWSYEGAGAGKTGYTIAAKHCYVGEANCSNKRLIVAILGSRDLWGDAKRLLDKGFELSANGQTLEMPDTPCPMATNAVYKVGRRHGRHGGVKAANRHGRALHKNKAKAAHKKHRRTKKKLSASNGGASRG